MMKADWKQIFDQLNAYPEGTHNLRPPCPMNRIAAVEKKLGALPAALKEMLSRFNGAELFVDAVPFITLFAITTVPRMSAEEWAPDWYLDTYTKAWRSAGGQPEEWAIAMTNYGGLMILDSKEVVREWDTGENAWGQTQLSFSQWLKQMLIEGDAVFNDE